VTGRAGGGGVNDAVDFLRTGSIGRTILAGASAATADRAIASVRAALTSYADAEGVCLGAAVWLARVTAPWPRVTWHLAPGTR
jgi:acyl-coenzyme A thioesterase PaaI-like protein